MQLSGLHHVTAVTANATQNVMFYTRTLGLRLVKKTVNQDDVSAYHLFYADAIGNPGTDVTFFDWSNIPQNINGAGSIAEIGLRVRSRQALQWWLNRFRSEGVKNEGIIEEAGREILRFSDPEGQALALVNDNGAPGESIHWEKSPVPEEYGIRGLNHVRLMVRMYEPTIEVLTEVMGFRKIQDVPEGDYTVRPTAILESGIGGPGTEVHIEAGPDLLPGRLGYGGVHHVAFRTPNPEEQLHWHERIEASGLQVTRVIDRFYFKSIYFREPGGILFEIATDGPGFNADEDIEHLGEKLALPPFLEQQRNQIESRLEPIEIEGLV